MRRLAAALAVLLTCPSPGLAAEAGAAPTPAPPAAPSTDAAAPVSAGDETGTQAAVSSVVPSEVCIDGAPVQVLSFGELPLEDAGAAAAAARAGALQAQGRAAILGGFFAGTTLVVAGLGAGIAGATTDRPTWGWSGVGIAVVGLGLGFGGVFGGRQRLRTAAALADDAIDREVDVTGRDVRWRTDQAPCENE